MNKVTPSAFSSSVHEQQPHPQTTLVPGHELYYFLGACKNLWIHQKFEALELITSFETENQYAIHTDSGMKALALEDSDCFSRQCLGPKRPFSMRVYLNNQEILFFERPYRFFFDEISVYSLNRQYVGKIKLKFSICSRELSVKDENGNVLYEIVSPLCKCWTFFIEKNFERVGVIEKKFGNILQELFTDADSFGINFPLDAKPNEKALLLAATILIDFLYFEDRQDRNHRNNMIL
ncbi:hypothetical protein ABK040_002976 [Willaertia magna]